MSFMKYSNSRDCESYINMLSTSHDFIVGSHLVFRTDIFYDSIECDWIRIDLITLFLELLIVIHKIDYRINTIQITMTSTNNIG